MQEKVEELYLQDQKCSQISKSDDLAAGYYYSMAAGGFFFVTIARIYLYGAGEGARAGRGLK